MLLGATAAKTLLGNDFRITAHRGEPLRLPDLDLDFDPAAVATARPSSELRGAPADREQALGGLVANVRFAYTLLTSWAVSESTPQS